MGGLGKLIGQSSGYVASLPAPVRRRIKALKKLQMDATNIEAKFYEEIHASECKYHEMYTPLYDKRTLIASGEYEPTEEECDWPSEDEDEEELAENVKEKARAVLFFTGEALDEEDSDEDSEDEDDDEDEDQDSDQDEDFDPSKAKANPECKQQ